MSSIDLDKFYREKLPEIEQAIQIAAWDNSENLDLKEDIIPLFQAFEQAYKAWKDEREKYSSIAAEYVELKQLQRPFGRVSESQNTFYNK